jgi:hypothetical protein
MRGALKRWKLGSYEAEKLGKTDDMKIGLGLSKLINFSTSRLLH